MEAGNLVRLTRASIGLPAGSIGLVIRKQTHTERPVLLTLSGYDLLTVKFVRGRACRFLSRDLEIVE